jgi:predicted nucleic-acid-binding protein
MIAVDTNVVVRLLTSDDARQAAAARQVFAAEQIWLAKTVLLETAWVLRKLYRFDETAIRIAFTNLMGLGNVRVEDETSVAAALELSADGVDLADAMHVTSRPAGSKFVSFDRLLIKRAQRAGVAEISGVV